MVKPERKLGNLARLGMLLSVLCLAAAPPITGTTRKVGPGQPYATIKAAMDDSRDGDTVQVYPKSSPYVENVVLKRGVKLIGIEDPDTGALPVIDGGSAGPVIRSNIADHKTLIQDFKIQNGKADRGGGIQVKDAGGLQIIHNTITGNHAELGGGGVYLEDSIATLENNEIFGNSSDVYGGGVGARLTTFETLLSIFDMKTIDKYFESHFDEDEPFTAATITNTNVTLRLNAIVGNTSKFGGGVGIMSKSESIQGMKGAAGGVFFDVELNFFTRNSAIQTGADGGEATEPRGGAFFVTGLLSEGALINNVMQGNSSEGDGGAVAVMFMAKAISHKDLIGPGNQAKHSGGAWTTSVFGVNKILEGEITGNTSVSRGGGIHCTFASKVIVKDKTKINVNVSEQGGGIYMRKSRVELVGGNELFFNKAHGLGGGLCYVDPGPDDPNETPTSKATPNRLRIVDGNTFGKNIAEDKGGAICCIGQNEGTFTHLNLGLRAKELGEGSATNVVSENTSGGAIDVDGDARKADGIYLQGMCTPALTLGTYLKGFLDGAKAEFAGILGSAAVKTFSGVFQTLALRYWRSKNGPLEFADRIITNTNVVDHTNVGIFVTSGVMSEKAERVNIQATVKNNGIGTLVFKDQCVKVGAGYFNNAVGLNLVLSRTDVSPLAGASVIFLKNVIQIDMKKVDDVKLTSLSILARSTPGGASASSIGIRVDDNGALSKLKVKECDIIGHTDFGFDVQTVFATGGGGGQNYPATDCFWGPPTADPTVASKGPTNPANPGGNGDVVTNGVDFTPFRTHPVNNSTRLLGFK